MQRRLFIAAIAVMAAFAAAVATSTALAEDDADDDDEVEVKLADCPDAVQKTLKTEAGDGTIDEIEKETENGKTVYEADVTVDGKEREIKVAEDGKLISNKLDDEEDDDEDEDADDDD